jgi:hypothetical protein
MSIASSGAVWAKAPTPNLAQSRVFVRLYFEAQTIIGSVDHLQNALDRWNRAVARSGRMSIHRSWRATTSQKKPPASFTSRPRKRRVLKSILVVFRANAFALYAALGPTSFAVPTLF